MTDTARLVDVAIAPEPAGIVLVLHGGANRGRTMRVSPAQLSVLRMIPIATRVARAGHGRLAVLRLLNSHRGWDTAHTPVQDLEWALAQVAQRFGADVPVCVIGHSLGGRAALLSAGRPEVTGVIALAPWVYPGDVASGAAATRVVIIHGDADRIADPDRSRRVADALRRETEVSYVEVTGGTHAMLSRRGCFDGLAADCAVWMLLGEIDGPILERIASGEPRLVV